jgi:hypothetical protein
LYGGRRRSEDPRIIDGDVVVEDGAQLIIEVDPMLLP